MSNHSDKKNRDSEKHGVLILSPHYSENHYPRFWNYNNGRMISDVAINKSKSAIESFKMNKNQQDWIFSDFDRMFSNVVIKLNLMTYLVTLLEVKFYIASHYSVPITKLIEY